MHNTTESAKKASVALGLFKLMRPKQWIKNSFVIAPLIFTGAFVQLQSVLQVVTAMLLFCVASSATYIINDASDVESDRKHPKKSKKRPIASGQVSMSQALSLLAVLYVILIVGFFLQPNSVLVIAGYLILNLAYTFFLKHQPVIDIFVIAIGFVLRVLCGAMALAVPLSDWMFVTSLCLALYLAAVKRRQELHLTEGEARKVLEHYTVNLVDRYAEMAATGALLFYSLYVMQVGGTMVYTIPFVLYGLFRYWFIVECNEEGESPTDALFSDWQLMLTIIVWGAVCLWSLWPAQPLISSIAGG